MENTIYLLGIFDKEADRFVNYSFSDNLDLFNRSMCSFLKANIDSDNVMVQYANQFLIYQLGILDSNTGVFIDHEKKYLTSFGELKAGLL